MKPYELFAQQNKLHFKNGAVLEQAFIHRSYLNEHKGKLLGHNERLEFLGDAVLELVVTDYLFTTFPDRDEGELTAFRSALVNATTLANVAVTIGVNDALLLSKGEARDRGRARNFILADTMEAIIGAIYVDGGYDAAQSFIAVHVFPLLDDIIKHNLWIDAKSKFQEIAQEKTSTTPAYKTVKEEGPDHDKRFTVGVFIGTEMMGCGDGQSKQDAEQAAARDALEKKGWL